MEAVNEYSLPHAARPYKCTECGNEVTLKTNHTGPCYPVCTGKCRQIFNPHTAHEIVTPKQTEHVYAGELS